MAAPSASIESWSGRGQADLDWGASGGGGGGGAGGGGACCMPMSYAAQRWRLLA